MSTETDSDTWTSAELAELRTRLESTRVELVERAGDHLRTGPICGDSVDHATQAVEAELDGLAEARDRTLLAQVELTLERLDRGLHGRCDECGGTIGRARLEAFPRATTCLGCARGRSRR